jgi:ribonuclease G
VKNNLEAVKEVVRQLRLRDIGGIIVIDFIDMSNPKNRATVEEALRTELERDRTKTYVVEISPLGLVEMTRQNVTDGPREILTTKCAVCGGDGIVVSEATHALEVERKLRELAKGSRVQAFQVAVHPRTLALLAGPGGERLAEIEAASRRRFFLVAADANGHVHLDHFELLRQGRTQTLAPEAPVEEGATQELKLLEVGLYDPGAAVAKLDSYEVLVAGAAKLVGKKVQVTIGRVLEGVALATLADAAAAATPITFEAEAEKPTRAPSRKAEAKKAAEPKPKPARAPRAKARAAVVEEPETVDADAEEAEMTEEAASADGQPKKKRTRRGSRGGRGRKKPSTAAKAIEEAELAEVGEAPEPPSEDGRRQAPKIHVPDPGLAVEPELAAAEVPAEPAAEGEQSPPDASDGEPVKKRTRRGSRGGRKRKKPAAAVTNGDEAVDAAEAEPAPASDEPAAEPVEYVPMSEWIEDFDRRASAR